MEYVDIDDLQNKIFTHLKMWNIFDLPAGRHKLIVEEFYAVCHNPDSDDFSNKLIYVSNHLLEFNQFLERQGKYKSGRLDVERQAELEPERTKLAISTLTGMGYRVNIVSNTEINFVFKGEIVRYYPYSGWASGRTIIDGRGLKNLIAQVGPEKSE